MEQHPIPQQISSYQFRLVGDMTLKQFLQLAGGALISLLIYSTGLHPILKWPLIIFFFAFGAALAFLPFQERPLEKWVIAFFRSIYSPTLYSWKQYAVAPAFFQPETTPQIQTLQTSSSSSTANGNKQPFLSNLEEAEDKFLNKLGTLFVATPTPVTTGGVNLTHTISPLPSMNMQPRVNPTPTSQQTAIQPSIVPGKAIPNNFPSATIVSSFSDSQNPNAATTNPQGITAKPALTIPQVQPLQVSQSSKPEFVGQTPGTPLFQNQNSNLPFSTSVPQQVFVANSQTTTPVNTAQFSTSVAPAIPENPNLVIGQVMDRDGKIIEAAILEITDDAGRPVRALKSNKVGHFMIVTPLLNGHYQIEVEKEGYEFDRISFEAKGEIIQPIAIKAKNVLAN